MSHTCALTTSGAVRCWGRNDLGQLGNGSFDDSTSPVAVVGIHTATRLSAGAHHTCALLEDGTVRCWGRNQHGQLGNGSSASSNVPVVVAMLGQVYEIAAGSEHSCARLWNDTVWCWGANEAGQIGNGTLTDALSATQVTGLSDVSAITVGGHHTCARRWDTSMRCWGANATGQLGDGTTNDRSLPVVVSGLSGATSQIGAGMAHTCARMDDDTVRCWGSNSDHQIGDGTNALQRLVPTTVLGLTSVSTLEAGWFHTCAQRGDGSARCWGSNSFGQLGDGTRITPPTNVVVAWLSSVSALALGESHSCARISDGSLQCWGLNEFGQLGLGHRGFSLSPVAVLGMELSWGIAAGHRHSCANRPDGSVRCWGSNDSGQLGDASTYDSSVPVTVAGLNDVASISTGTNANCALRNDGGIRCWGSNAYGGLGDGTQTSSSSPVAVTGIGDAIMVATGGGHACAVRSGGSVSCWGRGSEGQLGDGLHTTSLLPVTVSGLSDATAIFAGDRYNCALRANGAVACWGANTSGQIGIGLVNDSVDTPFPLQSLTDVIWLALGSDHSCALRSDRNVFCWGANGVGQTGIGNSGGNVTLPTPVINLSNVGTIAAGGATSCAVSYDSERVLYCWGDGGAGQFGVAPISAPWPRRVSSTDGLAKTHVAIGNAHVCIRVFGGQQYCWGSNVFGQLGNGESGHYTTAHYVPGAPFQTWRVIANAIGNGTVTPDLQSAAHGTTVSFQPTPAVGHRLASFTGIGCTPQFYLLDGWVAAIHGPCTVTAAFEIQRFALSYGAGPGGSVAGAASQLVDYGGSGSAVTAIPDAGQRFVQWSDGRVDNPRTDSNVTAAVNVNAQFAPQTGDPIFANGFES